MTSVFDYGDAIFSEDRIAEMGLVDVQNCYAELNELDQKNLFYVLLATASFDEDEKKEKVAAKVYMFIAHYLFLLETPPESERLAKYYIEKAILLDDLQEYHDEKDFILMGN